MSRRKPRSGHGDGLFSWAPADGEIQAGQLLVNALTVACRHPPCRATVGQRCTAPGRRGHPRRGCPPHPCRQDDAQHAQEPRTETP
jgi:hypothetical protein